METLNNSPLESKRSGWIRPVPIIVDQTLARIPAWVLPVAMSAVVYFPVTRNYFFADDFYNFWYLANHGATQFILLPHAGHSHVTRNAIIVLWYAVVGMWPTPYLALSLLTHLLNVYLLFRVTFYLTRSSRIACVLSGLWGIAPVQEQAVGWFAVYGEVLATTCALWVLAGLARWHAGQPERVRQAWFWGAAMIVGILSFAIGIGIAVVMPVVAWLFLPSRRERTRVGAILMVSAIVGVGLYLGQQRLFHALYDAMVWSTSPQQVVRDWRVEAFFLAALARWGLVALLLGPLDFPPRHSELFAALCLGGAMLLILLAVAREPFRTKRVLLACFVLAAGIYVPIAIGREPFTNAANQAWMVQTPRYQYAGMIAPAIAISIAMAGLVHNRRLPKWVGNLALAGFAASAVALRLAVGPPVEHYDLARAEAADVLANIKATASAAPLGSDVYIVNRTFNSAFAPFRDFPGWAAVFAIFSRDNAFAGHRIRFVVDSPADLSSARHGRRAPELLCRPPTTGG